MTPKGFGRGSGGYRIPTQEAVTCSGCTEVHMVASLTKNTLDQIIYIIGSTF